MGPWFLSKVKIFILIGSNLHESYGPKFKNIKKKWRKAKMVYYNLRKSITKKWLYFRRVNFKKEEKQQSSYFAPPKGFNSKIPEWWKTWFLIYFTLYVTDLVHSLLCISDYYTWFLSMIPTSLQIQNKHLIQYTINLMSNALHLLFTHWVQV